MNTQFKIIIPSWNSIAYLPRTIASIEAQTYRNFQVCLIDDHSALKEQRDLIVKTCEHDHWDYILHDTNLGPLAGIIEAVKLLKCQDPDVILIVDGDDWLYSANALAKLNQVYSENDVYLTWGSFETYPPGDRLMNYAAAVEPTIIHQKLYRLVTDVFGHPRTFKYRLFREIKDEDLRDPNTGQYFRVSGDKALLYPMLEMAGDKVMFINEVLYVYNIDNPLNDFKINRPEQIEATAYLRSRPSYETLDLP